MSLNNGHLGLERSASCRLEPLGAWTRVVFLALLYRSRRSSQWRSTSVAANSGYINVTRECIDSDTVQFSLDRWCYFRLHWEAYCM